MELLIKEVVVAAKGEAQVRDQALSVDEVLVGSSTQCHVQLLGAAAIHGRLSKSSKGLLFKCDSGLSVEVDGESVSQVIVEVGTEVEIAGHRLTGIESPTGFDAAIELHFNPDIDPSSFERAFKTRLAHTWLEQRRPAWIAVALVAVFGLIVPWVVPANYLPDFVNDSIWSSGPLHPAHAIVLGDDCGGCHTSSFTRVEDEVCTTCHLQASLHTLPELHQTVGFDEVRCASCHQEHHEPVYLTVTDSALCTDCHAKPDWPNQVVQPVHGFSPGNHPQFRLDLVTPTLIDQGSGQAYDWALKSVPLATAVERSNLQFSHEVHLDVGKVQDLGTGRPLSCASCHTAQADDEHFASINMERHCIGCHDLKFDSAAPLRNLPHGDPEEVILTMEGHFLRAYMKNEQASEVPRRRIPDQDADLRRCTDTAQACALERAAIEANVQFTKRGCVLCHEVVDYGDVDLMVRYHVVPIQLTDNFFLNARFNHHVHLIQDGISGDAGCVTCHAAPTSATSVDVLIPGIDQCFTCHDEQGPDRQIALECASCHAFHPSVELRSLLTLQSKTL